MTTPQTPQPADLEAELTAAHGALMSALASATSTTRVAQAAARQIAEITHGANTARDSMLITAKRLRYADKALDDLIGTAAQLAAQLGTSPAAKPGTGQP